MQPDFFPLPIEEELKIPPQYSSDLLEMTEFTNRPIFDYPYLRGGEITVGKENRTFKFKEDKGLWLGSQKFDNAPFRVDMTGKLFATGIDVSGKLIAETGSQVDWSYIQNILVQRAHIADLAVNSAKIDELAVTRTKIADLAVDNAKIANIDAGKITTGFLSADRIASGSIEDVKLGTTIISGGKIVTNLLTADNIKAGTLTGRTIKTAESGTRIELCAFDHPAFPSEIVFFNVHDESVGSIRGGASFTLCEGAWLFPSGDDVSPGVVYEGSFGYRALEVWDTTLRTRHLRPLAAGFDVGLSTVKYRHLYLSGYAYVGSVKLEGEFLRLARMSGAAADALPHEDGAMYYRTDDNVIRVRLAGVWKTISVT